MAASVSALLLWVGPLHAQKPGETVRIASAIFLGDVPTIVAEERGLFADQGIQTRVTHYASGVQSMAKLRAGEADFALMGLTPFVVDRLADEDPGGPDDPVILANLANSHGQVQIVTTGDSGIRQATDFRGRRIAVDRATNSEIVWWLYEQYHGIDRASIELVDLSFAEMPDAMIAGRIDAAVLTEPRVSALNARLNEDSQSRTVQFNVDNLYNGRWILVTTRRTAQERRALCRKLLAAYEESIEFIKQKPDEAISLFDQRMNVAEGVRPRQWNALDYGLTLDWALIASLQEQFLWARTVGYDNASGSLRMLNLFDRGPLHDIQPSTVSIPEAEAGAPEPAP